MDISSALQGLFTISVGSLLGISALHLHIKTGNVINIHGDGNIATIVKTNLFPKGVPVPGLQFRLCFLALCAAAIAFPSVSPLIVLESFWMAVIMIPLAFVGVMICQSKTHGAVYFIATMLISWMAIRNNGFMSFADINGPQVRPMLDQLFNQSPGSLLGFLSDYGPALVADLIAFISICALVMLQIWVGLAFLTNAGSYDNAFKLSFYSIVTAFALVCIVCGAMAAMQAPWLIWQGATEVNPMNMFRYGQAIFAHTFSLS